MLQIIGETVDIAPIFEIDPRIIYIFLQDGKDADVVYSLNKKRKFTKGRYEFRPVLPLEDKDLWDYASKISDGAKERIVDEPEFGDTSYFRVNKPDIMARVLTNDKDRCYLIIGNIITFHEREFSKSMERFMDELETANANIYPNFDIDSRLLTPYEKENPLRWFNDYLTRIVSTDKLYERSKVAVAGDYSTTVTVKKGCGSTKLANYSVFLEFSECPIPEILPFGNDDLCAYMLVLIASASNLGFLPKSIFDGLNRNNMPKTMNVIRELSNLLFDDEKRIEHTLFNYSISKVSGKIRDKKSTAFARARKVVRDHDKTLYPATILESNKSSSYYTISAAKINLPDELKMFPTRLEKAMTDDFLLFAMY